jgi:pyruvate carboxylase
MPGGATSSSQEGALNQGRIRLLPFILRFLAGTRRLVRYHDVTPGSQITWNTAFMAVTQSFDRGGLPEVENLLRILEAVAGATEENLSKKLKSERLLIYADANDAFRDLLLGRFGPLPLGFPPDWVYRSAFGPDSYKKALAERTEESPLAGLEPVDFAAEEAALEKAIGHPPSEEELVMYLNQPADALKTILFRETYGNPNSLPLDVWFEGLAPGQTMNFNDTSGKPHQMTILDIQVQDPGGPATVRYVLDSEIMQIEVSTQDGPETGRTAEGPIQAQRDNPYHVAAPLNGDLWVMYVQPGDLVRPGQELFNISIMKQEKAVTATIAGQVTRVLKEADFKTTRRMTPVRAGELIVELGPLPNACPSCRQHLPLEYLPFCPFCGAPMGES